MGEATENILSQALLYFRDEFLKDGLCMVLITDPIMLAKFVARAFLLVLHRSQFIILNEEEILECKSTYEEGAELSEDNMENYWTKESNTHAYPMMSFQEFQRNIEEVNFPDNVHTTKSKIEDLLVKAYGLCHESVLNELKVLSKSNYDGGKSVLYI
jgi:hypothetical protein